MAWYLDTSAAAKLVVTEAESEPLQAWLATTAVQVFSSDLLRTELFRAVRRTDPARATRVRTVLEAVTLLHLTTAICEHAAFLEPVSLRSLDAIHLASALALGDDLHGIITYDRRLSDAATTMGITTVAPS